MKIGERTAMNRDDIYFCCFQVLRFQVRSWVTGIAFLLFTGGQVLAGGDPGPGGQIHEEDLPGTQGDVHALVLDLSWGFLFPMGPDWRSELVGDDPSYPIQVRWRYTGPGFDSAVLSVYDANNQIAGEISLPLDVPPVDGYRYANLQIGDLPASPTLTMQVRDVDGRFCLRVSTDPGAIYQLWRVPIPGLVIDPSLGHLEAEITAEALETEFFFQPAVGVSQEFFFIADFQ
jgi:hypothetical protein